MNAIVLSHGKTVIALASRVIRKLREDEETKRPRVNKLGSQLDRTQKAEGEYYYSVEGS